MLAFLTLLLIGHHALSRPSLLTTPRKPAHWPIRHHPRLLHLDPYLRGDALAAIRLAARLRRRGLIWGIDQNGNRTADLTVWILHWRRWRMQYPFIWTGRTTRTGREIRALAPRAWPKHFTDLTDDQATRLRSSLLGGHRPHRARRHMAEAAAEGVPWCLEGKGAFASPILWDQLTADAKATEVTTVFMTLDTWAGWQEDLRQAVAHGWAAAVLPRRAKPADWAELEALGVQVWGRWR